MEEVTGYFIKTNSLVISHPTTDEIIIFLLVLLLVIFWMYNKYLFTPNLHRN